MRHLLTLACLIAVGSLLAAELITAAASEPPPRAVAAVANVPANDPVASDTFVLASLRLENRPENGAAIGAESGSQSGHAITATTLRGGDARLQLLVTGESTDGQLRDLSRQVTYHAEPAEAVQIDAGGLVTPLANATVNVTASLGGHSARTQIVVTGIGQEPPIHFSQQIVPIFTKVGCNGGGCHGKIAGQNGFRLSLLGFEPQEDYDFLVKESRGRRVSPAMPDRSLLLTKATNDVPHGGGQRLEHDSYDYRLLRRWIAQGMPMGDPAAPPLEAIEIFPASRRLAPGQTQQLNVIARYADGRVEDVSQAVVYESNDPSMADVSRTGLVQVHTVVGDVAVMARFQGKVAVFNADIPQQRLKFAGAAAQQATFPPLPEPANLIDEHVFDKLASLAVPLSPQCDDATFLRRVTLDIAGRLPTLEEVQEYATDTAADKRGRLVDRLLQSEDYAEHFAGKWGAILRNRRTAGSPQFINVAFHQWIRESLAENKPYDEFVGELLTASGSLANNPAVAWYAQVGDLEQRTEDAAQLFLGQRIQCARCHHHPYEKWSQSDYAAMSAFFSLVSKKAGESPQEPEFFSRHGAPTARHPKTGQPLPPAGLDAPPLQVQPDQDPREQLVQWMVEPDNPFFARTLVNRYWKHFMGRGLVEPEDDLRVTNPPSNPALMEALAQEFIDQGYDLKGLIRLICTSQTYGRASDALADNLNDRRSHSRFYPKRLTAEVLLDAVDTLTASHTAFTGMPPGTRAVALPDTGFGSYFLTVFGQPQSTTACECERSQEANLAQSLHLLNSAEIQGKLSADGGRAAQIAAADPQHDAAAVDALYQIALARSPDAEERQAVLAHLASKPNRREAVEDVIWSLINSKEFLFNH